VLSTLKNSIVFTFLGRPLLRGGDPGVLASPGKKEKLLVNIQPLHVF